MAPLRPPCRYNAAAYAATPLPPTPRVAVPRGLDASIRQRKAHSKRDMAKFAKEVRLSPAFTAIPPLPTDAARSIELCAT